jgi:NAD(P)-dependent dehydrogenase (short-subunit alcohol dehydrogenase family)
MPERVRDKVALVFGAGSSGPGWGNGKAAAVLYAREGARVVAVDVNLAAAEETCAIIAAEGGAAVAVKADVTREDEIAAAVQTAMREHGRIDILHNNVGITVMADPVACSEADWHRGMDTNLTGVFLTCKHVLPVMTAQGNGAIVNISSVAGSYISEPPYFSYYASKAGLNHFTRAVAVHYARRGIRANAIMPGLMDTPMIYVQIVGQHDDAEDMRRTRHARSPTGRMGDAWDVAYAALFLASDEAKYVNGVCLAVDGGLSCTAAQFA